MFKINQVVRNVLTGAVGTVCRTPETDANVPAGQILVYDAEAHRWPYWYSADCVLVSYPGGSVEGDAYDAGLAACKATTSPDRPTNPYPAGSDSAIAWDLGFSVGIVRK